MSLLIGWHVAAVFMAPFTFCTSAMGPAPSPAAVAAMQVFQPYADLTFVNHGYAFFAPDPGPNHLVRAHLEYADGRPGEDVVYPDLRRQWPRLLYHRHFMLTESLHARFRPPRLAPEIPRDSPAYKNWRHERDQYERIWQSYERHLAAAHGASSAVLTRIEHRQPSPEEFLVERMKLDDPRLYADLPETPSMAPGPASTPTRIMAPATPRTPAGSLAPLPPPGGRP